MGLFDFLHKPKDTNAQAGVANPATAGTSDVAQPLQDAPLGVPGAGDAVEPTVGGSSDLSSSPSSSPTLGEPVVGNADPTTDTTQPSSDVPGQPLADPTGTTPLTPAAPTVPPAVPSQDSQPGQQSQQ